MHKYQLTIILSTIHTSIYNRKKSKKGIFCFLIYLLQWKRFSKQLFKMQLKNKINFEPICKKIIIIIKNKEDNIAKMVEIFKNFNKYQALRSINPNVQHINSPKSHPDLYRLINSIELGLIIIFSINYQAHFLSYY